jgi:hypothetical protein
MDHAISGRGVVYIKQDPGKRCARALAFGPFDDEPARDPKGTDRREGSYTNFCRSAQVTPDTERSLRDISSIERYLNG